VGRDEELELIGRAMTSAASRGVVIAGAAGVGKTRLASEAVALAQARGLPTEWTGATHSAATMPFGAFAHLLPADARASERLELFGRIATLLSERAAGRRLVLGVD
jgi:hypothetical protein